ncbi:MAG: hypothetical protein NT010_13390 [Proteobacteria bacterium]|nr:hypothetical protein [Pseudomonadota bacterium]
MIIETLKDAIKRKVAISFEYNKPGKTSGSRIGNPHAIYIMRKNDGTESTKVDILQTSGVSDSASEKILPSFRMFFIEHLSNVAICEPVTPFKESPEYNPESDRYKYVIAKV